MSAKRPGAITPTSADLPISAAALVVADWIACIGVTWGYGTPEELLGAGAVALADTPDEVIALVQRAYEWPVE